MPRGVYPRKPGLTRNKPTKPLEERFWPKVDRSRGDDACWEWIGSLSSAGYGTFNLGRRADGYDYAHRVAYRLIVGPIPEGRELDHLCRNHACVNPMHLEAVTRRVNQLRGAAPAVKLHNARVCANGHPRSDAVLRKGTGAVVYCKACRRERRARERAKREAVPSSGD